MRHIFLASIGTLAVVAGLLALPAVGEPHAYLVAQELGDRLAMAEDQNAASSRQLAEPADQRVFLPTTTEGFAELSDALAAEAIADNEVVEMPDAESLAEASSDRALSAEVAGVTEDAAGTSTSTSAPATTTESTTTSTTSTTAAPSTTTTLDASQIPDNGGVLISPNGVVMPVVGRSSGGWRAMTPCGAEVTIDSGERVLTADFVLDPGHGGSETGSAGANGAIEKVLNLRIAEIVRWYLEEAGYSVQLTRTTDIRLPLQSRADIANALEPKAFVSIHHNGGATATRSTPGTEVFVDGGNPDAKRLGGILFEEMTSRLSQFDADWVGTIHNGVSTRLNEEGADLYGIHRFTPDIPSVITEFGYLSNPSEAELYADNEVQWAHGRAIADGLMRWVRTSDSGSGFLPDFVDGSSSGTGGFDGCDDPRL